MKKIYAFVLAMLLSGSGFSTHLMGGEMHVEHLGGTNYVIHFQAYRDTIGIPFALTATFDLHDSNGILVSSSTVSQLPVSGALMPGYPYGVEVYYFHDTISVPGPGEYTVRWFNCCRNAAIQNLTNPLAENMFLSTTFTNVAGATNSTPEFLAPPVTYLPISQPWQYNSLPFDVDGDSLSWSIDTPLTSYGVYAAGWVTPSAAAPADAFTIDAVTGQISWTPDMLGNFVASILVEEFNNGTKIGEIRRDYQMIVVPDTTKCPRISNFNSFPVDAQGHAYLDLTADIPINITLLAEDPEGHQVEFLAFGEPFMQTQNPATFTTQPYNNTDVIGTFNWNPDITQIRSNPYIVVFRTRDSLFTFDETVLFYVGQNTTGAVENGSLNIGHSFPNPTTDLVFIPLSLATPAEVSMHLLDVTGNKVAEYRFGMLPVGEHMQKVSLNVSSGTYLIKLLLDNRETITRKIVVTER